MGRKVTVDSATLFNKGMEVIEAHHLFGLPFEKISILIHPQAVVHSMVEFTDGSIIAQLGITDMKLPIQYALTYPERGKGLLPPLKLEESGPLSFYQPDLKRFPCFGLALSAGKEAGTMPTVVSAANEVAVETYLSRKISFLRIPRVIEEVMKRHKLVRKPGLDDILEADRWARRVAMELTKP